MEFAGTEFCTTALGSFAISLQEGGTDPDSIVVDRVDIEGDTARVGIEDDSTTFDLTKVDGE